MPFWSWRPVGDEIVLHNYLEGASERVPRAVLDELEAAYRGGPAPESTAPGRLGLLLDRADELPELVSGLARSREVPLVDQVELTNRCPYTCEMCPRTHFMTRQTGDLDLALFRRLIDEVAPHQSYLGLHHFGESLLHRGLPEAVRIGREAGVRAGISCNPPSLRPALAQELLDAGLANMVLSLDSTDPDTYRSIRGRAARFDVADRNLRELIRRRDAGGYELAVTAQMIRMDANDSEAERFLAYCKEIGVDRAIVVRLGRWDFEPDYIDRIGTVDAPGYTAPCSLPWSSVAVLWDGRVVPCAHDYDGLVVLGDLRERTLAEIWRDAAVAGFRAGNRTSELCTRCSFSAWYREAQREREGFVEFHRERRAQEVTVEWINPESAGWRDGRQLFDRFDVVTGPAR
ncbi:radical SAM protein [Rugosimonospora africana]|uniref:Radical SAM core domain-containing protein n=1 Tax=Rugosimonospora africana TaxID=556532 RepID=A0A8J3QKQ6_9ACTN|nr:radical SAM protein [Rugosimonospora africana]GIH11882.1 hypothetical protein Raf01_00540 [Rugosimonospora africana]